MRILNAVRTTARDAVTARFGLALIAIFVISVLAFNFVACETVMENERQNAEVLAYLDKLSGDSPTARIAFCRVESIAFGVVLAGLAFAGRVAGKLMRRA